MAYEFDIGGDQEVPTPVTPPAPAAVPPPPAGTEIPLGRAPAPVASPRAAAPAAPATRVAGQTVSAGGQVNPYQQQITRAIDSLERMQAEGKIDNEGVKKARKQVEDMYTEMTRPKKFVEPKEFTTLMGLGLMFAAVAGRGTGQPMASSMNAFASAVKGFHAGKMEQTDREMHNALLKLKQAETHLKNEHDEYNEILQDRKMRMQDKLMEVRVLAAARGNWHVQQAAQTRSIAAVNKALMDQVKTFQQAQRIGESMARDYITANPGEAKNYNQIRDELVRQQMGLASETLGVENPMAPAAGYIPAQ